MKSNGHNGSKLLMSPIFHICALLCQEDDVNGLEVEEDPLSVVYDDFEPEIEAICANPDPDDRDQMTDETSCNVYVHGQQLQFNSSSSGYSSLPITDAQLQQHHLPTHSSAASNSALILNPCAPLPPSSAFPSSSSSVHVSALNHASHVNSINPLRLTIMANSWIFIHDHGFLNTLHTYSWKNIDDPWQSDASWIFIHDCHP